MRISRISRNGTSDRLRDRLHKVLEGDRVKDYGPNGSLFTHAIRHRSNPNSLVSPYGQHPWIYAAAKRKATSIYGVPFQVRTGNIEEQLTGEGTPLPLEHEAQRLFNNPDPDCSGWLFRFNISLQLDLFGEALILLLDDNPVDQERDTKRLPTGLQLIVNSRRNAEPVWDENHIRKTGWRITITHGKTQKFVTVPNSRVCFIREPNPLNPYRGLSAWEAVALTTMVDWASMNLNKNVLDNGGFFGGVLTSPHELDPGEAESFGREFAARFGGHGNAGSIPVLEGDIKLQEFGYNNKDMEFGNLREMNRDEMLAVMGVPKLEVGLEESVNRATATVIRRIFWENTLVPRMSMIERELTKSVLQPTDPNLFGVFVLSEVPVLQEGLDEKVETAQRLAGIHYPLNMINDRLSLGMEDVDYGDKPLVPSGLAPLGEHEDSSNDDGDGEEGTNEEDSKSDRVSGGSGCAVCGIRDDSKSISEVASQEPPKFTKRDLLWIAYERAFFHPAERTYLAEWRRNLRNVADEQIESFLRFLRDRRGVKAAGTPLPNLGPQEIEEILLSGERWAEMSTGQIGRGVAEVSRRSLLQLSKELGGFSVISPDFDDPWILQTGARRLGEAVRLSLEDRVALRKVMISSISKKGITVQGVATDIRKFLQTNQVASAHVRALAIARTETASLANGLRKGGMLAEGIKKHSWLSARDDVVRPTKLKPGVPNHRKLDGEVVEIGKTFSNGGEYPSDPKLSAGERINCRCVAVAEK